MTLRITFPRACTISAPYPAAANCGAGGPGTRVGRRSPTDEGRADADLTPWLLYFLRTLATVFTAAREEALAAARQGRSVQPEAIRHLDPRARVGGELLRG